LNLRDNVGVYGDLVVEGNLIVKGNATISGNTAGSGFTTLVGGYKMQFGSVYFKPVYSGVNQTPTIRVTWPVAFKLSVFSCVLTPGTDARNPPSPVVGVESLNNTDGYFSYRPVQGQDAVFPTSLYYTVIGQ
jgi:hypothetical protein